MSARDKTVEIVIRLDGSCTIDAKNFTDAGCKSVTDEIVRALHGTDIVSHTKPEARIPISRRGGNRIAN